MQIYAGGALPVTFSLAFHGLPAEQLCRRCARLFYSLVDLDKKSLPLFPHFFLPSCRDSWSSQLRDTKAPSVIADSELLHW